MLNQTLLYLDPNELSNKTEMTMIILVIFFKTEKMSLEKTTQTFFAISLWIV